MARLGEVPFGLYYGSVDATPLFVMLAGMYFERTGDLETIRAIWPNIAGGAALDRRATATATATASSSTPPRASAGSATRAGRTRSDSIFHADGRLAEGPIALCEVQGYVFAAKRHAARARDARSAIRTAGRRAARRGGERCGERFEAAFWCDDLGTYALALDGAKRPCRVRSSNAGHALFAGIASAGSRGAASPTR